MLSNDLYEVAHELLKEFGTDGHIQEKGVVNPLTGIQSSVGSIRPVVYIMEDVLNTDALINNATMLKYSTIIFQTTPEPTLTETFVDAFGKEWNLKEIVKIELTAHVILYTGIIT